MGHGEEKQVERNRKDWCKRSKQKWRKEGRWIRRVRDVGRGIRLLDW